MLAPIVVERAETLVDVQHVSVQFGEKRVLHDVSATIKNIKGRGQVVGFLGPSGAGKTTLARVMAGLLVPNTGRVLIGHPGVDVEPGRVGLVQQSYPLFRWRTVMGNLRVTGAPVDACQQMLQRFGLEECAGLYPAQLSGGQRQRVAIGRQLLCSEHYLIMDEPFSGLDPIMIDETIRVIEETAAAHEHNTMILITHDVSAAVASSDTLWIMQRRPEGAHIVEEVDLIGRGLAWRKDIRETQEYAETVREVRSKFVNL